MRLIRRFVVWFICWATGEDFRAIVQRAAVRIVNPNMLAKPDAPVETRVKCTIRTFTYPDDSKRSFHTVCDGKPLHVLTPAFGRSLIEGCKKLKEVRDEVHYIG